MSGLEVIFALQVESLRTLEAKAEALRAQIERHHDPIAERRLESIELVLNRLYLEVGVARRRDLSSTSWAAS